jgi:hypothetical protein
MTLKIKNRVMETSTSTGTGDFTLAGAVTGYSTFASRLSTSDTCYYTIQGVDSNGNPTGEWESGLGTYSATNTLTRTTVQSSSNSDSAVTFSAGTKRVFIDATAEYLATMELTANKDASGGYVGLTLFKIDFKNAANTFTSYLTNTNTASRTYTFPDKDITVAGLSDIGTAGALASDTDGTLSANSDSRIATQKAVKTYVDTTVTGVLKFKGSTDCSTNPNFPAAVKGDAYIVTVAGKIGGASGISVDVGDVYSASADNAGGTQAAVGSSWFILEHNLVGALLSTNNLSDVANAATARANLGAAALAGSSSQAFAAAALTAYTNLSLTPASGTSGNMQVITAGATYSQVNVYNSTGGVNAIYAVNNSGSTSNGIPNGQGGIGTVSNSTFNILSNAAVVGAFSPSGLAVTGTVTPEADNTRTLGTGALRWSTVYAGTGTINTSDAREKTSVRGLTDAEIAAAKQLAKEVGAYQWLESVKSKGEAAREHVGFTVQRAIEIMQSNGLDPFNYGFICYDKWDAITIEHPAIEAADAVVAEYETVTTEESVIVDGEPTTITRTSLREIKAASPAVEAKAAWTETTQEAGDRYSFRYDELNLFVARGLEARLAALEAKS